MKARISTASTPKPSQSGISRYGVLGLTTGGASDCSGARAGSPARAPARRQGSPRWAQQNDSLSGQLFRCIGGSQQSPAAPDAGGRQPHSGLVHNRHTFRRARYFALDPLSKRHRLGLPESQEQSLRLFLKADSIAMLSQLTSGYVKLEHAETGSTSSVISNNGPIRRAMLSPQFPG
jgi:hypothetical protein